MRKICFLALVFIVHFNVHAQAPIDSTTMIYEGDTVAIKSYAKRFDPRKALLFSAILPGLGQAYNKKYWKIPIIYGGFYGIGLIVNFDQKLYRYYKNELYYILETGSPQSKGKYSQEVLRPAIDRARRDRDFWMIMMGLLYILQIVDAHVDAHLKEFDLNPNLKVGLKPMVQQNAMFGRQTGVSLSIKF